MTDTLCSTCKKHSSCTEPFPTYECDDYEKKPTGFEIVNLFFGMSESMQKAVFQIMEATQWKDQK